MAKGHESEPTRSPPSPPALPMPARILLGTRFAIYLPLALWRFLAKRSVRLIQHRTMGGTSVNGVSAHLSGQPVSGCRRASFAVQVPRSWDRSQSPSRRSARWAKTRHGAPQRLGMVHHFGSRLRLRADAFASLSRTTGLASSAGCLGYVFGGYVFGYVLEHASQSSHRSPSAQSIQSSQSCMFPSQAIVHGPRAGRGLSFSNPSRPAFVVPAKETER